MVFAFILFLAAAFFVYMLVFPLIFEFFIRMKPDDVRLMIDISSYLEMIISLFIAFGLAFQIPLLVIGLAKFNLISTSKLKAYRSYVLVFAFIFGAIFTPPDVISQLLLAIPVYLLYEVGIMFAKNSKKRI
jgi:sec-independent protein translocase protein TatC